MTAVPVFEAGFIDMVRAMRAEQRERFAPDTELEIAVDLWIARYDERLPIEQANATEIARQIAAQRAATRRKIEARQRTRRYGS